MNGCGRTKGFSLVELLIAMAIGLILLAGIVKVWLGSRQIQQANTALAAVQESGRFAISVLERNIRLGGFPLYKDPTGAQVFDSAKTADADPSDGIAVDYAADQPCRGVARAGAAVKTHAFTVVNGALQCSGIVLATGIDAMQIQYGVDTDKDGIANQYLTATRVKAGVTTPGTPDWPRVVSVRVALLVNSGQDALDAPAAKNWVLLDRIVATNDRRMRRLFTTTIPMRNRMETAL